jgi:hypothetical protein
MSATKGGFVVDHHQQASIPTAQFDAFLFASVCEEANGMRLSVLSALARMNVDPWEEATRLAAMPRVIAEKTLVSILDLACGRNWQPPEAQAVAARLVRLLPQAGGAAAAAAPAAGTASRIMQQRNFWWVWVGFALAMAFMSPHHEATTPEPGMATTQTAYRAPMAKATAPVTNAAPDIAATPHAVPIAQSR